jgi:hypothetical protein
LPGARPPSISLCMRGSVLRPCHVRLRHAACWRKAAVETRASWHSSRSGALSEWRWTTSPPATLQPGRRSCCSGTCGQRSSGPASHAFILRGTHHEATWCCASCIIRFHPNILTRKLNITAPLYIAGFPCKAPGPKTMAPQCVTLKPLRCPHFQASLALQGSVLCEISRIGLTMFKQNSSGRSGEQFVSAPSMLGQAVCVALCTGGPCTLAS